MKDDLNPRPHCLFLREQDDMLVCETCLNEWLIGPRSLCVGVPVYAGAWEKVWPEGLMTKTQLNEAGYTTGKKLPPVAALLEWNSKRGKKRGGYLRLYDPTEATPKRKMSDAQRAALEKAKAAKYARRHCSACDGRLQYSGQGLCYSCQAVNRARELLKDGEFVILDTETTGLESWDDPIQIAVIDANGKTLLDTLVQPRDLDMISPGAYNVHHIGKSELIDQPTFPEIYPKLAEVIRGKTVLVYNEAYDIPLIEETISYHGLPPLPFASADCVMLLAARWIGHYSSYWDDWKWYPLPGGDHSALGDCRATLEVLRHIAADDMSIYFW